MLTPQGWAYYADIIGPPPMCFVLVGAGPSEASLHVDVFFNSDLFVQGPSSLRGFVLVWPWLNNECVHGFAQLPV